MPTESRAPSIALRRASSCAESVWGRVKTLCVNQTGDRPGASGSLGITSLPRRALTIGLGLGTIRKGETKQIRIQLETD